jgi:hypothetical protein
MSNGLNTSEWAGRAGVRAAGRCTWLLLLTACVGVLKRSVQGVLSVERGIFVGWVGGDRFSYVPGTRA